MSELDLKNYKNRHSLKSKIGRVIWNVVWQLLFRPTPRGNLFRPWRIALLKLFGAKVEDIAVESEVHYEIAGEDLAFSEPVMPTYMSEEVLFKDESVEEEIAVQNYDNVGGILDNSLLDGLFTDDAPKKVYEDKSFASKMLEADTIILDRYAELKNIILKYIISSII